MQKETKVEIVVAGLVAVGLLWLWLANTKATGQTGTESLPLFLGTGGGADGAGGVAATTPVAGLSTTPPSGGTFNIGGITIGGIAAPAANPAAGMGCGCGCNGSGSGSAVQFATPNDLDAFLASLPQYQAQQAVASGPIASVAAPSPIQWVEGQGALWE
jgi:hypothetical protein